MDSSCRKDQICKKGADRPVSIYWEEVDQKELKFLTLNRPARRFLYFRFVITYLHAKKAGYTAFTQSVENKKLLWASSGPYLHNSTLKSLARNITGIDLPPTLAENTFNAPLSDAESDSLGTVLASELREATINSLKNWNQPSGQEGESDEHDESCSPSPHFSTTIC